MVESARQVLCSASMSQIPVSRMSGKEFFLLPQSILHRVPSIDILLAPVDNSDETEFERVSSTG